MQLLQLGPIPDHVQLQPAAYKTKLYYPTQRSYDNNTCSKIKFKYTFLETSSQINNIVIVINLVAQSNYFQGLRKHMTFSETDYTW